MDADEAYWEVRQEYAEDLYNERLARNALRCQCTGMDMPGHCPGPNSCPMASHDEPEPDEEPTCSRCAAPLIDGNGGCADPACPGEEA
jgi:hypothetical protein